MLQPFIKKCIYSLIIFIIWWIIVFSVFYSGKADKSDSLFVITFILIYTLYFSIAVGIIVILLRMLKIIKPQSFLYIFGCVINICTGLIVIGIGVAMIASKQMYGPRVMGVYSLCFFIGIIMGIDAFRNNKKAGFDSDNIGELSDR
jgi:hypothetical protein